MKKFITLVVLLLSTVSHGQLSVHAQKQKLLDAFLNTETIFVLSNIYDTQIYDDILKETWKVTPYKIVRIEDFNAIDYIDGKHSFALLGGSLVNTQNNSYIYTGVSFFIFDMKAKMKEIEKLKKKSDKKKEDYDILKEHRMPLASIPLFMNTQFVTENYFSISELAGYKLYNEKVFYNYTPGLLKNYFQKLNSLISEGKGYSLYGGTCEPEIKNLKKATLYIPEYVIAKFDRLEEKKGTEAKDKEIEKLFKDYRYKYEFIGEDELSRRILADEEFYYLRYVVQNNAKYIQIVNSKTGEVIYKNYHPMSFFINKDNIEKISKSIETGKV